MCNNCIHKAVCGKFRATGGVKVCEHHKEERRGRNITTMHPVDEFYCSECGCVCRDAGRYVYDEDAEDWNCFEFEFNYCPNCGADMRGGADG